MITIEQRAKEIADFLGVAYEMALWRLQQGFHYNHAKVAEDFKRDRPQTDEDLLNWYRETDAYIWELSIYHYEPAWNHMGRIEGAALHLKNANKTKVLVLGDGIGDLSLALYQHGLDSTYNDLYNSKTANFAQYRFNNANAIIKNNLTVGWHPVFSTKKYDAVVAWDFFEHLPEDQVSVWARAVHMSLKSKGIFQADNAFAIGTHNQEDGDSSIPMHEASGERWVTDWNPMMLELGFKDMGNSWWEK